MNKYPEYVMRTLREMNGLEEYDTGMDLELSNESPNEVFSKVLQYDGLMGSYDSKIKRWIRDIYEIEIG